MSSGVLPRRGARSGVRSSAVGEAVGQQPVDEQGVQEGVDAGVGRSAARPCGCRRVTTGAVRPVNACAPRMGSWLMVWTPSRRRLAVKPICRSAGRLVSRLAEPEVAGVVDGRFRPDRLAQLVVLLDFRVLIVDVQARGDPVGDDPGAEPARGGVRPLA